MEHFLRAFFFANFLGHSELKLDYVWLPQILQKEIDKFNQFQPTDSDSGEAIKRLAKAVPEEFAFAENFIGIKKGEQIEKLAEEVAKSVRKWSLIGIFENKFPIGKADIR